jgi:glycine/D-amino acid oxidase-like deaminating enzyme
LQRTDAAVIGGGIIGTTSALELQRRGHAVTIVEPNEIGSGTAAGSAGYLAWDDIFPIPNPGAIADLPRMLLDKRGPLVIKPSYLPHMIGWGMRFLLAARPSAVRRAIEALSRLNRQAEQSLVAVAERAGAQRYLVHETAYHVSHRPRSLEAAAAQIPTLLANGIAAEILDRAALLAQEPALSEDLAGAIAIPGAYRCTNPSAFGATLAEYFRSQSGAEIRARATAIERTADGWSVRTSGGDVLANNVVIAAGAWSGALLRGLGYRLPLESARGYHLMLPQPNVRLGRLIHFNEPHFVATPMEHGLRLAGTVEFAGIDAPPNDYRAEMLFDLAREYLPALRRDGAVQWMGHRPSLPDSLPVIAALRRAPGIVAAIGHERRGLTESGITALCVADLVEGKPPPLDLQPFAIERF